MSLVVDASVATAWFIDQPPSQAVRALQHDLRERTAPALIVAELGNALWKAVRTATIDADRAAEALEILEVLIPSLHSIAPLRQRAFLLALELQHPIYNCFYIALAERKNAGLVTADKRLAELARRRGVETRRI